MARIKKTGKNGAPLFRYKWGHGIVCEKYMKDSWGGFSKGPDAVDGSGWELGEMVMASVIRTVMMLVRTLVYRGSL